MTELTDLSDTDANNTAVTGQSIVGNVANMGGMDNLFQATLGMLSRFRNSNIFQLRDNSDNTKKLAFGLSGISTATTRTLTVPDASGTLSLLGSAETFSGVKTFSAIPVLSAGGIKFPATQIASTDPNTLDDYEENSWTPLLTFAGGSTGQSMSVRSGSYVKIGKVVHLFFSLTLAVKGSSTGDLWLEGFPFTVAANNVGSGVLKSADNFTGLTGPLTIDVRASTTRAFIGQWTSTGTSAVTDANVTNTSSLFGMVTYHAAD